jgi:hypothetical protein
MFLASYALISNTVLLICVSLAERFMYWPSVPLLLVLAIGLVAYGRRAGAGGRGRLGRVLGVLLLAGLATRSLVRNMDWASNLRLFAADVRTHPEGAHLNKGYALELLYMWQQAPGSDQAQAILETAQHYLDRALQIHPGYVEALALRGQVRAQLGDVDGALLDVEAAIRWTRPTAPARRVSLDARARTAICGWPLCAPAWRAAD